MGLKRFSEVRMLLAGLAVVLASAQGAVAETKVGSTVESRLMAGFDVPAEALDGLMPDG